MSPEQTNWNEDNGGRIRGPYNVDRLGEILAQIVPLGPSG